MTDPDVASATEASVGEALAAARRARGLTAEDVAQQLKFGVRQIEALESGRFERLPGGTFARGMVRAYARLVRLDPGPLVAAVAARAAAPLAPEAAASLRKPIPFSDSARRLDLTYVALSLLALGVIVAVAWEWHAERGAREKLTFVPAAQAPLEPARLAAPPGTPLAAAEPPATAPEPPAQESLPEPGKRRIALRFEREAWVQIRGGDGKVLTSQLNPAGTEKVVTGEPPFELVIGNAHHVRLAYDDRPIDLKPHVKVEVARFTLR
jgi:cytoskeleton protein RodZ